MINALDKKTFLHINPRKTYVLVGITHQQVFFSHFRIRWRSDVGSQNSKIKTIKHESKINTLKNISQKKERMSMTSLASTAKIEKKPDKQTAM